jgi:hypothetical protein
MKNEKKEFMQTYPYQLSPTSGEACFTTSKKCGLRKGRGLSRILERYENAEINLCNWPPCDRSSGQHQTTETVRVFVTISENQTKILRCREPLACSQQSWR